MKKEEYRWSWKWN